jgi:hypothetical protein
MNKERSLLSRRGFLALSTCTLLAPAKGKDGFLALAGEDDCKQCCTIPSTPYPKGVKAFLAPVRAGFCIVSAEMKVGHPFSVCAVFDEAVAGYTKYEYRQYLKGYFSYLDPVAGWTNVPLGLRGTAQLSAYDYHEDGFADGTCYGYRNPYSQCCDDAFGPTGYDRQRGWLYTMADFPGMWKKIPANTQYQIKLDFCFDLVDSSTSPETVIDRNRLPVRCCGELPKIGVCPPKMPENPPGPDFESADPDQKGTWRVSQLKPLNGYFSRVIIELRPDVTVARVNVIKPNNTPPIDGSALKLILHDDAGRDLGALAQTFPDNAPMEGLLVEVNSASTTAQKIFIFPRATGITQAIVLLNNRSAKFEGPELNVL